ncbi:sulfatase-like hydrolase/transferase [Sphingomicrobium nitratireducens]|uniref:sulfatase-like hydrolase/transferase n=1 Tax=Sphingomicrobium nitratireducens TaxID=2964666 RepID=UPI0022405316|nr:sulfatase-like hydrolase/transferase [Sphingomicrobium nitratireducens]
MTGWDPDRSPVGTRFAWVLAANAMVLLGHFATFLRYRDYPMWRAESLIVAGLLVASAAAVAWFYARGPRMLRLAWVLLLGIAIVDFAQPENGWWLLLALVAVAVHEKFGLALFKFATVMFASVLLFALAGWSATTRPMESAGAMKAGDRSQRAIVHFILDEQAGPDGLALLEPSAPGIAQKLAPWRAMGFAIAPHPRSDYSRTKESIPQLMRLGAARDLTETMAAPGRSVRVVQSTFFDLCAEARAVDRCDTYGFDRLDLVAGMEAPLGHRAAFLGGSFLKLAHSGRWVTGLVRDGPAWPGALAPYRDLVTRPRANTVNAKRAAGWLEEELARLQPGEAWVVHLLLPHFPYALREDCTTRPIAQWLSEDSAVPIEMRARAYSAQLECTNRVMARLVAAIEASPAGRDTVILAYGDHGARIRGDHKSLAEQEVSMRAPLVAVRGVALPEGENLAELVAAATAEASAPR